MKLRLPNSLVKAIRGALYAAAVATLGCAGSFGGTLHEDISMQTYTDFGQNMGRYVTGNRVNALLAYIRSQEGITITYTGGEADYRLQQNSMVSFDAQADNGASVAIGYNYIATVRHNAVQNPTFTSRLLPENSSVRYSGIEYRESEYFLLTPEVDYKITRLSKVVTDVETATLYTGELSAGDLVYRSGSGNMTMRDTDGNIHPLIGPYNYSTGGITSITNTYASGKTEEATSTVKTTFDSSEAGISTSSPLPMNGDEGDSGSPLFIWNAATQQYEYIGAMQSVDTPYGGGTATWSYSASQWSQQSMDSYNVQVDAGLADGGYVYVSGAMRQGESLSEEVYDKTKECYYTRTGELWTANVEDRTGKVLATYAGVRNGVSTWDSLSDLKDTDNWYAYGDSYLNANERGDNGKQLTLATLYRTQDLVFSSDKALNTVEIDAGGVDLGVGYARFSRTGVAPVSYTVSGGAFNHAGYIVDAGVSLHLQSPNQDADYMREWRKVGEGDLYIEGTGDNQVFLNLGGAGTTHLCETGGYAAYNVLANTGSRVVLGGINQIARDFTFGNGGAFLDFNGHSMEWNNGAAVAADGFTIHALTEEAVITNGGSTAITLRVTDGGDCFLGSFRDTASADLNIVYAGAGNWDLHGMATSLTHGHSGLTVESGSVTLGGTLTVHALGSETGTTASRLQRDNDWHYADAAMPVSVQAGGTFTLGSHARLTGSVTVEQGGTFVMNEAVQHRLEYVEGGSSPEDTDAYADYVGMKGSVTLNGGAMRVVFSEATDTATTYGGSISGTGSLAIAAGAGTLHLTGDNSSFSGTRTVENGTVSFGSTAAMGGSAGKWLVQEHGVLVMPESGDFSMIDPESTGVIALAYDTEAQAPALLDIGAAAGTVVHYGSESVSLQSTDGVWLLGGGGGNLVVDFLLEGNNRLILGNGYSSGTVTLANANNTFSGGVELRKGIRLVYDDVAALGKSRVIITYGVATDMVSARTLIDSSSTGALLIDTGADQDWDLSATPHLSLAVEGNVTFSRTLTVAEGADYHLGGAGGTLAMETELGGNHGLMVDGQGSTGGTVVLASAATLTGDVTVQGYDSDQADSGGVTLSLTTSNALSAAAGVTVRNNALMELNGTAQRFHSLSLAHKAAVTDSSAGRTGTLDMAGVVQMQGAAGSADVLRVQDSALAITADGNTVSVSGDSGGQLSTGTLTINAGQTLRLNADNLSITAAEAFINKGKLIVDQRTVLAGVSFQTEGGTITANADLDLTAYQVFNGGTGNTAVNQLFAAAQGGSGTILLGNGAGWIFMGGNADITARFCVTGGGLELNSQYNNYSWKIKEGGSLTLTEGRLMLENTAGLAVEGGKLNAAQGITLGHADGSYAGHLTLSGGSVATREIYLRNGGNSFTMSGGTLTVTGGQLFTGTGTVALSVSAGTLAANGNSWELNHDVRLGDVSIRTTEDSTISFTGQTVLTQTLHNAGNISFAMEDTEEAVQLLSATGSSWEEEHRYYDSVSGSTVNGFEDSRLLLVKGESGSSLQMNGRTRISVNGSYYDLHTDGVSLWFSDPETGIYVVNEATLHYGAADNAALSARVIRLNGGNLDLEKDLNACSISIAPNRAAGVYIAGSVTLNAVDLTTGEGSTASLTGAGAYVLATGARELGSGVSLADDWCGIVAVSMDAAAANAHISSAMLTGLGNRKSSVQLTGMHGYLDWETSNTYSSHLVLENGTAGYAVLLNANSHARQYAFTGNISGAGTWQFGSELTQDGNTYTFSGDVSGWTGKMLSESTHSNNIVFDHKTGVVNAELVQGSTGVLNISANAATAFNNTIDTKGSFTINADVAINADATVGSLVENGHAVSLGKGTDLTITQAFESSNPGNSGNKDSNATVNLTVNGGEGSSLHLAMNTNTGWNYNNTIRVLAEDDKPSVQDVYVSGAMAYDVFSGTAQTDLGRSNLHLADGSVLEIRKNHETDGSGIHITKGDIVLAGTTEVKLYGNAALGSKMDSDIRTETDASSTLKLTGDGGVTLDGTVEVGTLQTSAAKGIGLAGTAVIAGAYSVSAVSEKQNALLKNTVLAAESISGGSISNSLIDLQKAVSVNLGNITLTDSTVKMTVALDQNAAATGLSESGAVTLANTLDSTDKRTLAAGTALQNITLGAFSNVQIMNGRLCLTLSAADSLIDEADWLVVSLGSPAALQGIMALDSSASATLANTEVLLQLVTPSGRQGLLAGYMTAPTSDQVYFDVTGLLPEPSTAALTLLALAGLASRRRRK